MADTPLILKRFNGSTYDKLHPETTWTQVLNKPSTFTPTAHTHDVDELNTTGTPSASTFLRGDGQWATPPGVDNYVNISGDTMTGTLVIENDLPIIRLNDTNHENDYEIRNANGSFSIYDLDAAAYRLLVNSTGNVGIGTTTPSSFLTLSQSMTSSPYHIFMDTTGTSTLGGGAGIIFGTSASATETNYNAKIEGIRTTSNDGSSELRFSTTDVTTSPTPAERMRITEDGNVGIGTTTPNRKVTIASEDETPLVIHRPNNSSTAPHGIGFSTRTGDAINSDSDIRGGIFYDYNGDLFLANSSSATNLASDPLSYSTLFIEGSNSNVGIGTTTPSAQLQVKSGATTRVPLVVDSVASLTANLQEWKINGSDKAFLDSAGYFRAPGIRGTGSTNNSQIDTATTGTTISRNVADTNPALIVNLANASATGDIVKFQKAGTTVATVSNNGEITAPKFYLSADSDGANEIPNWAFSEYNNKPCVSSEYISDTYYPIYHEGNMPPGSWTEIYTGETTITAGTGTTTVTLTSGSIDADDVIAIEFHTLDTEATYTTNIEFCKLGTASSLYSNVWFPSYNAGTILRFNMVRVWRSASNQLSFAYAYQGEVDASPTTTTDALYVGKVWKINGVTGV